MMLEFPGECRAQNCGGASGKYLNFCANEDRSETSHGANITLLLSLWGQDTFTIIIKESSGSKGLKPGETHLGPQESAAFGVATINGACGHGMARNAATEAAALGFAGLDHILGSPPPGRAFFASHDECSPWARHKKVEWTNLLAPQTFSIQLDLQGSADDSCS